MPSFKDELTAEVNSVRNNIKTEAIDVFVNRLKVAMKNVAARGRTNGAISLRINYDDVDEDEDDDVEIYRLDELLLLTNEREPSTLGVYIWLIDKIDKIGVFKDIYINLNAENYELEFFWYMEE